MLLSSMSARSVACIQYRGHAELGRAIVRDGARIQNRAHAKLRANVWDGAWSRQHMLHSFLFARNVAIDSA
jgi:hypothetical protein